MSDLSSCNTAPKRSRLCYAVSSLLMVVLTAATLSATNASAANHDDAFVDDNGSVHEPALNALAAEGYLAGTECGEQKICPTTGLKRWELAVWLGRALTGTEPEPVTSSRFGDVDPAQWWSAHVERFADLGITVGCSKEPLNYCPDKTVNRAQMATFLTRAYKLFKAPPAGFVDTETSSHFDNINALDSARVTTGCETEPYSYCPQKSVTRAQMATFIARASGLIEKPLLPGTIVREGKGEETANVNLAAGRYLVSVKHEVSSDQTYTYFTMTAYDTDTGIEIVARSASDRTSGTWTSVLEIGDWDLEPGKIVFEADTNINSENSKWKILIAPLKSYVTTEPAWPVIIEGQGRNATSPVYLPEGSYRFSLDVAGTEDSRANIAAYAWNYASNNVGITSRALLVNEVANSGSWSETLNATTENTWSSNVKEIVPGPVWFALYAHPDQRWSIEIKPA